MKLFWIKEVLIRLQEFEEYISRENPIVAMEFVDKLISIAETIIDYPEKRRIVPEISLGNIRVLIHKNYRIVYLVKISSVNILTMFEGRQLLKKKEIFKSKK